MKTLFILTSLLLSSFSFADRLECIKPASKKVLLKVSKELKIDASKLKIRHIGGEYDDHDSDQDISMDLSIRYFDIFLKSEDPSQHKALTMESVEVYTYWYESSGEFLECAFSTFKSIDQNNWEKIYKKFEKK